MSEGEENAFGVWMMEGQFRFERVQMTRSHAGPGPGIAENPWLAAIGWWSVRAEDVIAFCVGVHVVDILSVLFLETELVRRRPSGDRFGGFLFLFPSLFFLEPFRRHPAQRVVPLAGCCIQSLS